MLKRLTKKKMMRGTEFDLIAVIISCIAQYPVNIYELTALISFFLFLFRAWLRTEGLDACAA